MTDINETARRVVATIETSDQLTMVCEKLADQVMATGEHGRSAAIAIAIKAVHKAWQTR